MTLTPQEVGHFELGCHFLAISMCCILTNSSYRFYGSHLKFGLGKLKTFVMKSYQKLSFLINGVAVAWRPF